MCINPCNTLMREVVGLDFHFSIDARKTVFKSDQASLEEKVPTSMITINKIY